MVKGEIAAKKRCHVPARRDFLNNTIHLASILWRMIRWNSTHWHLRALGLSRLEVLRQYLALPFVLALSAATTARSRHARARPQLVYNKRLFSTCP